MRASLNDEHVSGAEEIVVDDEIDDTVSSMTARAMNHPRETPDSVEISIEEIEQKPERSDTVDVVTVETSSLKESHATARSILQEHISKEATERGFEILRSETTMRGAAVVDSETGERLEPDESRGVRTSYVGTTDEGKEGLEECIHDAGLGGTRVKDAVVLSTKTQWVEGTVGEICWSDNPGYKPGYVAVDATYFRFPRMKPDGSSGGRVYFVSPDTDLNSYIDSLETTPFLVDGVSDFYSIKPKELDKYV